MKNQFLWGCFGYILIYAIWTWAIIAGVWWLHGW